MKPYEFGSGNSLCGPGIYCVPLNPANPLAMDYLMRYAHVAPSGEVLIIMLMEYLVPGLTTFVDGKLVGPQQPVQLKATWSSRHDKSDLRFYDPNGVHLARGFIPGNNFRSSVPWSLLRKGSDAEARAQDFPPEDFPSDWDHPDHYIAVVRSTQFTRMIGCMALCPVDGKVSYGLVPGTLKEIAFKLVPGVPVAEMKPKRPPVFWRKSFFPKPDVDYSGIDCHWCYTIGQWVQTDAVTVGCTYCECCGNANQSEFSPDVFPGVSLASEALEEYEQKQAGAAACPVASSADAPAAPKRSKTSAKASQQCGSSVKCCNCRGTDGDKLGHRIKCIEGAYGMDRAWYHVGSCGAPHSNWRHTLMVDLVKPNLRDFVKIASHTRKVRNSQETETVYYLQVLQNKQAKEAVTKPRHMSRGFYNGGFFVMFESANLALRKWQKRIDNSKDHTIAFYSEVVWDTSA